MRWQSVHLFNADAARSDAFLLEVVGPAMDQARQRGQLESWFFVRYWECGPHLRLRVKGMPPAAYAGLLAHLRAHFPRYCGTGAGLPAAYPDAMVFERSNVDAAARRWLAQGTVLEADYEPEWQRYGGVHALAVSERLFARSSALAMQIIAAAPETNARRTRGLLLTCVALAAGTGSRAGLLVFLQNMQRGWQALLGDVRKLNEDARAVSLAQRERYLALIAHLQAAGDAPEGIARDWWHALQDATAQWRRLAADGLLLCPASGAAAADGPALERAIAGLADSHIHMMNNRLGLLPEVEYWYARMLEHAALAA